MKRLATMLAEAVLFITGAAGCGLDLADDCSDWTAGEASEWRAGADPPMDPDMWARFENR